MAGVTENRVIDSLLTTTLAAYRRQLVDNIFDAHPLISWAVGKLSKAMRGDNGSIKRVEEDGESIVEHLLFEENSTLKWISGAETINTDLQEGLTIARYEWKLLTGTIGITGIQRRANRGKSRLLNLLGSKTKQLTLSVRKELNQVSFGDGTGTFGKEPGGLENLVSATAVSGGIDPAVKPWWAATVTASGSFANQGPTDMENIFNTVSLSSGNDTPDFIVTTQAIYQFYKNSLSDKMRYTNTTTADARISSLLFNAIPIVWDRLCPAGRMYFLNSTSLAFVVMKDADMSFSPFVSPEDQDGTTSKFIHQCNWTTSDRRKNGVLTGITE